MNIQERLKGIKKLKSQLQNIDNGINKIAVNSFYNYGLEKTQIICNKIISLYERKKYILKELQIINYLIKDIKDKDFGNVYIEFVLGIKDYRSICKTNNIAERTMFRKFEKLCNYYNNINEEKFLSMAKVRYSNGR